MSRPWKIGIIIACSLLALLMIAVVAVCYDLFIDKGITAEVEVVEVEKVGYFYEITVKVTNPGDHEIQVLDGFAVLQVPGSSKWIAGQSGHSMAFEALDLSAGHHVHQKVLLHHSSAHGEMESVIISYPKGNPDELLPRKIGNFVAKFSEYRANKIENYLDRNYLEVKSRVFIPKDGVTKVSDSPLVKDSQELLEADEETLALLQKHPGHALVKAFSEKRFSDVESILNKGLPKEASNTLYGMPNHWPRSHSSAYHRMCDLVFAIECEVMGKP